MLGWRVPDGTTAILSTGDLYLFAAPILVDGDGYEWDYSMDLSGNPYAVTDGGSLSATAGGLLSLTT